MEIIETIFIIIAAGFVLYVLFMLGGMLWLYLFSDKEEKEKASNGKSCLHMILCVIIVIAVLALIGKCSDNTPWQPRHTQIQKPMQNNVNAFIFTLS